MILANCQATWGRGSTLLRCWIVGVDLLNPTDTSSGEEAESGNEGMTLPSQGERSVRQLNNSLVAGTLGWMFTPSS